MNDESMNLSVGHSVNRSVSKSTSGSVIHAAS